MILRQDIGRQKIVAIADIDLEVPKINTSIEGKNENSKMDLQCQIRHALIKDVGNVLDRERDSTLQN